MAFNKDAQNITGPVLTTSSATIKDNIFTLQDNGDTTKQLQFELSSISTATTRTLTSPDFSGSILLFDETYRGTVTTTNNTTTTILTIATASNTTYLFRAHYNNRKTAGAGIGTVGDSDAYIRTFKVKNVSGTVTIGTINSTFTDEDIATNNVTQTVSGTNVLIQVTGSTSNTIDWVCITQIIKIS